MEFGQEVNVTNILKRHQSHGSTKYWLARKHNAKAIFLGFRTLANGRRDYVYEEGYSFSPDQHFKAALVCEGVNTNPYYTLVEFDIDSSVGFDTRKLTSSK